MPFVTRCPYCRFRIVAPDRAMTASAKCPSCQSWFTATPDTDPSPGPAPAPPAPPPPPRPAAHEPEPAVGAAVALVEAPPPAPEPEPDPVPALVTAGPRAPDEDPGAPTRPHPLGVAACLAAAAALVAAAFPAAAFLTRPLAGAALLLGAGGWAAAAGGRAARQVLPAVGTVVGGVTLLVALVLPSLLGPRYEAGRQRSDFDPDAVRVVPLQLGPGGGEGLEADGFADAGRAAVQQGSVRVRVLGATVGPVPVSGADGRQRPSARAVLAVAVEVQHLGHGDKLSFAQWGTSAPDRTVPPAAATAGGRPLGPPDLGRDVPAGITYRHDVHPGKSLVPMLLFERPPAPGPVRLELPAEAWGGRGSFRFEIPGPMIVTQPSKKSK